MSKVSALYHVVFATKHREMTINSLYKEDLYRFIWSVITAHGCRLLRIGGVANHLHILLELHPNVSLSNLVRGIKSQSSSWLKSTGRHPQFNGWASEYYAATLSFDSKDAVIEYIKAQEAHHGAHTFDSEMQSFAICNDISYHSNDLR